MSELSPATIAQLPKLEGEASYQTWSLQIKATAQCGGFWGPFIGDNTPAGSDAADIDRAAQREQKACGLMLKTVSSTIALELDALQMNATVGTTTTKVDADAKTRWDHLKTKYQKSSGMAPGMLFTQLTKSYFVDDGTNTVNLLH